MMTLPPLETDDVPTEEKIREAERIKKRALVVEIAKKLQNLRHREINETMRRQLCSTNRRNLQLHGRDNKAVFALLSWWGSPEGVYREWTYEEQGRAK